MLHALGGRTTVKNRKTAITWPNIKIFLSVTTNKKGIFRNFYLKQKSSRYLYIYLFNCYKQLSVWPFTLCPSAPRGARSKNWPDSYVSDDLYHPTNSETVSRDSEFLGGGHFLWEMRQLHYGSRHIGFEKFADYPWNLNSAPQKTTVTKCSCNLDSPCFKANKKGFQTIVHIWNTLKYILILNFG